ncbi:MAG TPA: GNAT family N-acetyltransferase [Puia sp.]|nr:GNAT family N-acetyltransferase [Puia sp.]
MDSTTCPTLTTPRLVLRQLSMDDENEIYLLRNNEKVNTYIARPKSTTREEAGNFIKKIIEGVANHDSLYWAITLKNEGKLIGTICFWNISEDRLVAEIGYELSPVNQGRGIMQEALQVVLEYGFQAAGFTTIEAYTHPENEKSSTLLEKFLFKRKEGKTENEEIVYILRKPVIKKN